MMVLEAWRDDLFGASSLIRQAHEKAIYVRCMNHRLNLSAVCFVNTCSLAFVSTMVNVVRTLSGFFTNSPKRQQCLIAKIRELLANNKHRVLIDVSRTSCGILLACREKAVSSLVQYRIMIRLSQKNRKDLACALDNASFSRDHLSLEQGGL